MRGTQGLAAFGRAGSVGLLAIAAVYSAWVHAVAPLNLPDDAYITFRYVENTVATGQPVYNEGERIFGVSTPLYWLWLVLCKLALPSVSVPSLAARGNIAFLLAAAGLAWMLLRRLGLGVASASVCAAALLVTDEILRQSIGGMECSLFTTLVFATCLAIAAGRDAAAVWLASLASLARPEGLILVPVALAAWLGSRRKRERRIATTAGLLPLGLWTAFATAYFGSPVPHSVLAKARGLYPQPPGTAIRWTLRTMGGWSLDGALILWQSAGRNSLALLFEYVSIEWLQCSMVVLLFTWAAARWWKANPAGIRLRESALPAFLLLLLAFYAVTNPQMMAWYFPVLHAGWLVWILGAAFAPGRPSVPGTCLRGAVLVLVLGTTLWIAAAHSMSPSSSLIRQGSISADREKVLSAYVRSGNWVAQRSRRSDTVAAGEIGILGYTLDRKILDACGLVTHEALPFIPSPVEQRGAEPTVVTVDFVRATQPDFVVSLAAYVDPSLLKSPWFLTTYELVHEERLQGMGTRARSVMVYRLKDAGPPPGDS